MSINFDSLSDDAQVTIAELETSKVKNRRGITRLSAAQIRRLEAEGKFPKSRKIQGTRCRFYVMGEVRQWLRKQIEG